MNIENYNMLLQSPSWKAMRNMIIKRDQKQCACCKSKKNLQVHHKQYHFNRRTGMHMAPWQYHPKYLITLCKKCHKAGHEKYKVRCFQV